MHVLCNSCWFVLNLVIMFLGIYHGLHYCLALCFNVGYLVSIFLLYDLGNFDALGRFNARLLRKLKP